MLAHQHLTNDANNWHKDQWLIMVLERNCCHVLPRAIHALTITLIMVQERSSFRPNYDRLVGLWTFQNIRLIDSGIFLRDQSG